MRFFIGQQGRQTGPFTEQQVRDQLTARLLRPEDLAWREGMPDWQPLSTLFNAAAPTPPPLPPFSGVSHTHDALAGLRPPAAYTLAKREIRLVAYLIDVAVTLLAAAPGLVWFMSVFASVRHTIDLEALVGGSVRLEDLSPLVLKFSAPLLAILLPCFVVLVIQTWLLTSRGQSLGKMWLRIRIVRTDGRPASFTQVVMLRSFAIQLCGFIPMVGGIVSLADPLLIFRADRRCLHDLLAGTTVIDA